MFAKSNNGQIKRHWVLLWRKGFPEVLSLIRAEFVSEKVSLLMSYSYLGEMLIKVIGENRFIWVNNLISSINHGINGMTVISDRNSAYSFNCASISNNSLTIDQAGNIPCLWIFFLLWSHIHLNRLIVFCIKNEWYFLNLAWLKSSFKLSSERHCERFLNSMLILV